MPVCGSGSSIDPISYREISTDKLDCKEILGDVGKKIVKGVITLLQIVGAIIAIVKATLLLVPAVAAKDAEALKAASKKLITLAIVLVLILLFKPLVNVLGKALEFDVSCII